jgi:hypothetical protein
MNFAGDGKAGVADLLLGFTSVDPLVILPKTNWTDPPFLMGKSTTKLWKIHYRYN